MQRRRLGKLNPPGERLNATWGLTAAIFIMDPHHVIHCVGDLCIHASISILNFEGEVEHDENFTTSLPSCHYHRAVSPASPLLLFA